MADNDRQELEDLMRLDELETKASGGGAAFVPPKVGGKPAREETKGLVSEYAQKAGEYLFGEPEKTGYSSAEMGVAAGVPAAVGALGPRALKYGGKLAQFAFPEARLAKGAVALGEALQKVPLLKRTTIPAVAGATGSAAEQTAEIAGAPRVASVPIGIATGSVAAPLGKTISYLVPGAPGRALRGTSKTFGELFDYYQGDLTKLPNQAKAQLESQLEAIRGGKAILEPELQVYQAMKSASDKNLSEAAQIAANLENQVKAINNETELAITSKTGQLTTELNQRIKNIETELDQYTTKLTQETEKRAKLDLALAESRAKKIEQDAANQTPEIKTKSKEEAKNIINNARAEIDKNKKLAEQEIKRVRGTIDQLKQSGKQRTTLAQSQVKGIGDPVEATPLGRDARSLVEKEYDHLKEIRETNVKEVKTGIDQIAKMMEKNGYDYTKKPSFLQFKRDIENARLNAQGLSDHPAELQKELDSVLQQLQGVVSEEGKIIKGRMSFNGLEEMRRIYRDQAFGLPKERASAMEQQLANNIASHIEQIQREMVGDDLMTAYLGQYARDSVPLRIFNTPVGQALVGKLAKDPQLYKRYAADIGSAIFNNAESVEQFTKMVGPQNAERLARQYLATQLKNKTVQQLANDPSVRDWVVNFPSLQKELGSGALTSTTAESIAKKRTGLADLLKTKITNIEKQLGKTTGEVTKTEAKKARDVLSTSRQTTAELEKDAAERAALERAAGLTRSEQKKESLIGQLEPVKESVVERKGELESDYLKRIAQETGQIQTEAQAKTAPLLEQAATVQKTAQDNMKLLLSNTTPETRLNQIFFGSNEQEWDALAKVVKETPGAAQAMEKAIGQLVASRPTMSTDTFNRIAERLVSRGLTSQAKIDTIASQLRNIRLMNISEPEKSSMIVRILKTFISPTLGVTTSLLAQ